MKNQKYLSIILLSYYSNYRINEVFIRVRELLNKNDIQFEFIIIDDGSNDESYEIAKELESQNDNVFAYQLSRNYTSDYSIMAAYSVCNGDCAVYIPDDGQPDVKYIVDLYREWEKGEKITFLLRSERNDPFFSKIFAKSYYYLMDKLSDVKYPPGGVEIALIDREIIDIVKSRIHPINTAIVPELVRLGFSPKFLYYDRPRSSREKSRWSFKKKIRLAKNVFFSSSSFPIRSINYLGYFFSTVSFLLIIFYIYVRLFGNHNFWGNIIPGWTSIILFISFFSGLILLSLGIIAEYIWRIFEEVKNRPGFIIKKKG